MVAHQRQLRKLVKIQLLKKSKTTKDVTSKKQTATKTRKSAKAKVDSVVDSEKGNGKSNEMSEESEEDCLASTPVTPEKKNSDLIFIFQKTGFKRVYDLDYGIDLSGPGAFLQTCSGAEALAIWRNKFENPVTTAAIFK